MLIIVENGQFNFALFDDVGAVAWFAFLKDKATGFYSFCGFAIHVIQCYVTSVEKELFDKWTRFEAILQASFEDLNPMLVETLKLYPFLQRQKPHVLIRLGFHIKLLWDAASPQEPSERVEIPEDF